MDVVIRAEQDGDQQDIHNLLVSAFPTDQEALLVRRLRRNGHLTASWVAIAADEIIGHVAFSPVTISGGESPGGAGLAPLAVHSDYRRHGIGARLVQTGLECCQRSGIAFVVVLGEPEYYVRFGFRAARNYGVENNFGVDESFLLLELRPGSVQPGLAQYAEEFTELEG